MSAMSELARQHDEARDLSGIDLVECELSYHKEAVAELVKALESLSPMYHAHNSGGVVRFTDCQDKLCKAAREALAKAKELSPARDAGTSTDR